MSEKISRNDMLFRNSNAKHPIEKIEVEKEKTKDKSQQEKQTNSIILLKFSPHIIVKQFQRFTTDCHVGFKMMLNSVLSYKRADSPHVINPLEARVVLLQKRRKKKKQFECFILSPYLTLYILGLNLMKISLCFVVKCFTIVSYENLSKIFFCRNFWILMPLI